MLILALIFGTVINIWISYYLSDKIYKKLQQNKVRYAVLVEVFVFLLCFATLTILAVTLILNQVHLER